MYFGLGAHPGFKVPLEEGLAFEDYYLEFKDVCEPDRVIFSANALVDTPRPHYPLEGGKRITLHHDLFDDDAVVLEPEEADVSPAWAMDGRTRAPEPRIIAAQTAAPKARLAAELNRCMAIYPSNSQL